MIKEQPFQREMWGTFPSIHRLAICKHCRRKPAEHLEDGKCVFEATYFEIFRLPMETTTGWSAE